MIVLDTHAWIWWLSDPGQIPSRTRSRIDVALDDGALAVSAISAWEVAMLVAKGRLELALPVDDLVADCERLPGFTLLPLTARIAVSATRLALPHPDPADRFIAATALAANATLITKDERLRASDLVRTAWA
ncbi:MAG: type II toxin-antitoxin system VapC family toxin [Trueperaceae bacterium]|nr:type II toxin-antitoxin system VapC family toxin [Trueperaceae bacterium]